MDKLSNAGLIGIVGFEGTGLKFGGKAYFWDEDTSVSSVDATGQGDGDLADSIALIEKGSVIIRAKLLKTVYPFPATLKNASGTITFTFDKGLANLGQADIQMTGTFRVTRVSFKYDEAKDLFWDVTLGFDRISALTPTGWNANASQPTTTARTAGNKYLYAGRNKLYDPNTLRTSAAQRFIVWGISADTDAAEVTAVTNILSTYNTPPQSSLQQHHATVERLSSAVVRISVSWSLKTTVEDLTLPATKSVRAFADANTDSVGQLITTAVDVASLSNTLRNSFQGTDFAHSLSVQAITANKKFVVFNYRNPGVTVSGRSHTGSRLLRARQNPSDATKIQLFVSSMVQYTSNRYLLAFAFTNDYSTIIRDFVLFRLITSSTIPENSASSIGGHALPDIGQINSDTFLGMPAHTVAYQGPKYKVNVALSTNGAFAIFIGWYFHNVSTGIIEGVPTTIVQRRFLAQISNPTAVLAALAANANTATPGAWCNITDIGFGSSQIKIPTAASFAAFTA